MENVFKATVIAGLLAFISSASALPQTTGPAAGMENGSILYAELSKTVDAKKARVGDPVTALLLADVVARGKIVVRRDSKLIGHVTEAQPRSKENPESRLGIAFDKIIPKGGQEVAIRSLLLALRPAPRPTFDVPSAPSPPGVNPAAGPAPERHYPSPKGPTPKMNTSMNGELRARDQEMSALGATDIDGLSLSSQAGSTPIVVSIERTVKLESGVRIELRVMDAGQ